MDINGNIVNTTNSSVIGDELKLGILKICLFSTFFVLGLIGNSLVLIGIGLNKGMQTSTNLLIFNLALADILFIIVCIPTTLFSVFGRWPFREFGCKLAQFINHLSAFMSIYLLVFMSIDRYFAVVHAIDSISNYRTIKNTTISIIILWLMGICLCIPIGSLFTVVELGASNSMYCLLRYLKLDQGHSSNSLIISNTTQVEILPIAASLYWLGFVIFLYALPLTIIVILYGLMLKFLRGARGQSVGKSKRRAIRMILAVILTYAFCWFFMQLLFISNIILSRNTSHHFATYMDVLNMLANVFAYLNSCTNPILYGFMSRNFRSSFIDLLCCRYSKRNLFGANESFRRRRLTDNNNNNTRTSLYGKNDCLVRTSVPARFSQLTPRTTALEATITTSLSRITAELTPMHVSNEERQMSTESNSPQHVKVEFNETHRRRKQSDRSPVVSYSSLVSKPTEVLST